MIFGWPQIPITLSRTWANQQRKFLQRPHYDSHYFKTNLRDILTLMSAHQVPRWITTIWLSFVVSLILTSIIAAIHLNCDLVWALGLLVVSSVVILLLSVIAWLALYGLSILLEGIDHHKAHCDDSKYWGGMADIIP